MKSLARYLVCVLLFCSASAGAAEFREGRIKLVLHESTGRFSLYYMTDITRERYEPFFVDQDPRTSFLAILADDKYYRMGEASAFRVRLRNDASRPAFIFESSFLTVTQEFSYIQTAGSTLANGISMVVTVENKSTQESMVGVRFLLDTNLGEGEAHNFETDRRALSGETLITSAETDRWWYSRSKRFGLMGSIVIPGVRRPDSIHFANWKRLNDAPWKIAPSDGRNFNLLPYSVGDSAVSYYFDPEPLPRGSRRSYTVLLAAEDAGGFSRYDSSSMDDLTRILQESVPAGNGNDIGSDLLILRDLLERIDRYIVSGGDVPDEELDALELMIARIKARYGLQ
ncbi:DUF2913 family protein [Breznakiella homolactica]|uniref:Uncharacterized protein n=1 Tax=Breznakiella homolactica TaxID=2798577 RepID=A0A7T7XL24_9SPIR|nr:DUF2913 family protein [Breznakiella homolactica]QQO08173.1 DUF2913 family protein [Breznakiella homolactica]